MTRSPRRSQKTLAQRINRRAASRCIPLSVLVEVTHACNLRCYYCYLQGRSLPGLLTVKEWTRIFGELADAGTLYLTISGGEPFLRSDILEIIAQARARDFAVGIISNGTLVTAPTAQALADLGIVDIGISFHAAEADLHDKLEGKKGSFNRALATVRRLKKAGVRVMIKHSVSNLNFGEFRALVRFAEDEGCLFECDSVVVPHVPGSPSPYALTRDQQLLFLRNMGATEAAHCLFDKKSNENLHCDAGRSLCGISPSGNVVPCIQLPVAMGSLKHSPFAEIWGGPQLRKFRRQEKSLSSHCLTCDLRHACARCHGIAWYETGSWRGASPSLCDRAWALAER